ncbi:PKD domain-containing protein [bacterium]|nr:PKD domain-containing protein [candidate division CSSED10-310 bacterium]
MAGNRLKIDAFQALRFVNSHDRISSVTYLQEEYIVKVILNVSLSLLIIFGCVQGIYATTPHTITIDGNTSDFADDELVWNDSSSDCAWDFNELYRLYITWDANALYIGADFLIEELNSLSFYMDFGYGDGAHDLGTVAWLKYFYTNGWLANFSVNCSGDSTPGIFRIFDDNSHDEWTSNPQIQWEINLGSGMYEIAIPWTVLYSGSFPANATGGFVCVLTGFRGWDGADAMPQQSVEPDGDGSYDTLDTLYTLNFDSNGDGVPESGWHPDTNSGEAGEPPYADARAEPSSGPAPLTVHFEGIGNDPDGGTVTFKWNFGDGSQSTEQNPVHTYTNPGDYTAVLTVTDDEMQTKDDSVIIHVTGANEPSLDLSLSKEAPDCFVAGDFFDLQIDITNPATAKSVDLYILLAVYGYYYFYPAWTENLAFNNINLPASDIYNEIIMQFDWPSAGAGSGLFFYAAMFEPGTFDLVGNLDIVEFCYQ